MADENTTPTGETQTIEGGEGAAAPAAPKNNFVGSATGKPLAAPEESEGSEGEGEGAPPAEGEEGGEVVGHGGKPMSQEAIAERTARAVRANQRKLFGTDDEEEIKRIVSRGKSDGDVMSADQKKEFDRLKRLEETRKRSRMTQQQRDEAAAKAKDERIQELESQIKTRDEDEAVRTQDQSIIDAASPHIDPGFMKYARRDLAEHLQELREKSPDKFARFGQKQLEQFFTKYAAEKPAFAKKDVVVEGSGGGASPTPPKAAPVKKPATTTRTAARPPAQSTTGDHQPGMYKGKTVKPGQPNSMNKQELREYAKVQGVKLNY